MPFVSPSHDVEAGFSLGGPATDKDGRDAHFYYKIVIDSGVGMSVLCLFVFDFNCLIYSSCITS